MSDSTKTTPRLEVLLEGKLSSAWMKLGLIVIQYTFVYALLGTIGSANEGSVAIWVTIAGFACAWSVCWLRYLLGLEGSQANDRSDISDWVITAVAFCVLVDDLFALWVRYTWLPFSTTSYLLILLMLEPIVLVLVLVVLRSCRLAFTFSWSSLLCAALLCSSISCMCLLSLMGTATAV